MRESRNRVSVRSRSVRACDSRRPLLRGSKARGREKKDIVFERQVLRQRSKRVDSQASGKNKFAREYVIEFCVVSRASTHA